MGNFGITLRRHRNRLALSVEAASELAGISTSTWQAAEKRHEPTGMNTRTIGGIARAIGVSVPTVMTFGCEEEHEMIGVQPVVEDLPRLFVRLDRIEARLEDIEQWMRNGGGVSPQRSALSRSPPEQAAK